MLEIAQAGQAGKTSLLLDMHRLRKRVFNDRMQWKVHITPGGLEVDDFDLPDAVYLLALDDDKRVIGCWRMLPTKGPTMIGKVWPQFLDSIQMQSDPKIWEASRFAVDSPKGDSEEGLAQVSQATQELFCGLTELCLLCGIEQVFTMYNMPIARLLRRLDCPPAQVSATIAIEGQKSQVGTFVTNEAMLRRLRAATKINRDLITRDMIPPALTEPYKNSRNLSLASPRGLLAGD